MSTLPDEVVERLCSRPTVRLVTGPPEAPVRVDVHLAPLHKQLYAFVAPGSGTEANLLAHARADIVAEDPAGEWSIRVRGRGVAGRTVNADPRRSELVHWMPEGGRPQALVAARLYPESVDYTQGKGSDRSRAAGPVPEGPAPPFFSRWWRLATEGVVAWFVGMAVLDWLALLALDVTGGARTVLLGVMVFSGATLLAGETMWDHANRFFRWREGFEDETGAGLLLLGWEPAERVRKVGLGLMATGLLVSVLVSVGGGWEVGVGAVLFSGVPALLPAHAVRHAMRRADAAKEET